MDKIYQDYMINTLKELVGIDSPSLYCKNATDYLQKKLGELGVASKTNNKGALVASINGNKGKTRAVAAHVDTLGAMIQAIDGAGRIRFTKIGGPILATWDGEYCTIHTRSGRKYSGTFLSVAPSTHVYKDAATMARDTEHMYIRLDERVKNADDVKKLGIEVGDIVSLDPKFTLCESGYVKSRFLDDKAGSAIVLTALKYITQSKLELKCNVDAIFTTSEEIGHGGAPFGNGIDEVLAVDMGCIGGDLKCTEHDVSICAMDSSGPYDYELVGRLKNYAQDKKLSYAMDVYPYYGSDVSCMLRAGADIKGALIGPGVHASHGMERTHIDGMNATLELVISFLLGE